MAVIPTVPLPEDESNVHVPVVVKPPAVIVPEVESSALFLRKTSSTLKFVPERLILVHAE